MCIYVCWWVSDRERNCVRIPSATIITLPPSFFCKHFWCWKPSFTKKISSGSSSLAFLLVKNEPHNGYHFVNFSKEFIQKKLISPVIAYIALPSIKSNDPPHKPSTSRPLKSVSSDLQACSSQWIQAIRGGHNLLYHVTKEAQTPGPTEYDK